MNYTNIWLNLFYKQFRDPNKIIADATVEIDACVIAICFQLFDARIKFGIITKYCYGSLKDVALKIMEKTLVKLW